MPSLFEAYITNLGKYAEGELVGETLKFPTTAADAAILDHTLAGTGSAGNLSSLVPGMA